MPTYSHRSRVDAPLEDVWAFFTRVEGLKAVTPDFLHLEVEAVRDPEGEPDPERELDPERLVAGSETDLSMRPFGVAPRQRWTSVITGREAGNGVAWFRDEMRDGPFPRWTHTHRFRADGDGTIIEDRVVYRLPFGSVGRVLGPLAVVGFEPMFRYRHWRTRQILE